MKMLLLAIVALVSWTGVALVSWTEPASAVCTLIGTLVRVDVLDVSRKDIHTLYLRERRVAPHLYKFSTDSVAVATAAGSLAASGVMVEITGDEPSCPTSGQERDAGFVVEMTVGP